MKELENWFTHINAKRTEIADGITMFTLDSPKETDQPKMSIYRGYDITKTNNDEYVFSNDGQILSKTEEEAMNKIDSIERERVARDQANIQRVDNQIKK